MHSAHNETQRLNLSNFYIDLFWGVHTNGVSKKKVLGETENGTENPSG